MRVQSTIFCSKTSRPLNNSNISNYSKTVCFEFKRTR